MKCRSLLLSLVLAPLLVLCSYPVQSQSGDPTSPRQVSAGPAPALSGILGGGPFYQKREISIPELKASGFTMVEVWTIHMDAAGDLDFNDEFPLVSDGQYIGHGKYPHFKTDIAGLKVASSSITKVNFGLSAAGSPTFKHIKNLVASQGTGSDSILYKNFKALRANFPTVDAINFDDESTYHAPSATQFAIMLADIGFKVAFCPYTNKEFWTAVIKGLSSARRGSIDAVYLQTYDGGARNTPDDWSFPGIPTYPGRESDKEDASSMASTFSSWRNRYGTSGGWVWLYDQVQGRAGTYAAAINKVFGIATRQ